MGFRISRPDLAHCGTLAIPTVPCLRPRVTPRRERGGRGRLLLLVRLHALRFLCFSVAVYCCVFNRAPRGGFSIPRGVGDDHQPHDDGEWLLMM